MAGRNGRSVRPPLVERLGGTSILLSNNILKDFIVLLMPLVFLRRVILSVWGVTTVVVGAFIFGQSTTIAIMELRDKF